MEVQLYVYDLSRGLARQLSAQLLGTYIEAVYHTSIVLGGIEYFFGFGVQTCAPGSTHHGPPMEVVPLGKTSLPIDIILEYLESLKEIYTPESYDLFAHNCNNFSNDFAMFLVGRGIPEHITSLPQTVLNTPFGQMLRPQLDQSMRSITQAPVAPAPVPRAGTAARRGETVENANADQAKETSSLLAGKVHDVTSITDLEKLLNQYSDSCAVLFFTSSSCAPCALVYPVYESLAAEAGKKAIFIRVDVSKSQDIGALYQIRATPTFQTSFKGQKQDEWSGADENRLRANIQLLLQLGTPIHPHRRLKVQGLLSSKLDPIVYAKIPPMEKLMDKLGPEGREDPSVKAVRSFLESRNSAAPLQESALPDFPAFCQFLLKATSNLPREALFAAYDLLRAALADPRVSSLFATTRASETVLELFRHVNALQKDCPYSLRLVSMQTGCNMFAASAAIRLRVLETTEMASQLVRLAESGLNDDNRPTVRAAAAALCFNIAAVSHRVRMDEGREVLEEDQLVEVVAAIFEAIENGNESRDVIGGLVRALGLLIYCAPMEGELRDMCRALEAKELFKRASMRNDGYGKDVGVVREVEQLLECFDAS